MKCEIGKCNDSKEMYKSEVQMQSYCFANLILIIFSAVRRLSTQNAYRETVQRTFTFFQLKRYSFLIDCVYKD